MLKQFLTAPLILLLIAILVISTFATDVQQVFGSRAGNACRIYTIETSAESEPFGLYADVDCYVENDVNSLNIQLQHKCSGGQSNRLVYVHGKPL